MPGGIGEGNSHRATGLVNKQCPEERGVLPPGDVFTPYFITQGEDVPASGPRLGGSRDAE